MMVLNLFLILTTEFHGTIYVNIFYCLGRCDGVWLSYLRPVSNINQGSFIFLTYHIPHQAADILSSDSVGVLLNDFSELQ